MRRGNEWDTRAYSLQGMDEYDEMITLCMQLVIDRGTGTMVPVIVIGSSVSAKGCLFQVDFVLIGNNPGLSDVAINLYL